MTGQEFKDEMAMNGRVRIYAIGCGSCQSVFFTHIL